MFHNTESLKAASKCICVPTKRWKFTSDSSSNLIEFRYLQNDLSFIAIRLKEGQGLILWLQRVCTTVTILEVNAFLQSEKSHYIWAFISEFYPSRCFWVGLKQHLIILILSKELTAKQQVIIILAIIFQQVILWCNIREVPGKTLQNKGYFHNAEVELENFWGYIF
jgi:hypothetical protein